MSDLPRYTGTNGKTTTSRIIESILEYNGIPYISNRSGANLASGVTTTLIEAVDIFLGRKKETALIEIDEAAFALITEHIKPDVVVVTNFFRDQLDRYGELYTTLKKVVSGINKTNNTLLVLNADDSLCTSIARDTGRDAIFFGISGSASPSFKSNKFYETSDAVFCMYCEAKYSYGYNVYSHLGSYKCPQCGYERPAADVECVNITELSDSHSDMDMIMGKNHYKARINLPGIYNIYNALAAASCAYALGFPPENTLEALGSFDCGFGRMETIESEGKTIKVILVKNPTGFNQVIDYLLIGNRSMSFLIAINDNIADGTDISWLWDVDFEKLQNAKLQNIFTCGTRAEDMALRLKYAGLNTDIIHIYNDTGAALDKAILSCPEECTLYILPTYTAMLQIRKLLKKKFGLKEFWK
jgi:UDP-N-acetylmuramyl tripeptide synthase